MIAKKKLRNWMVVMALAAGLSLPGWTAELETDEQKIHNIDDLRKKWNGGNCDKKTVDHLYSEVIKVRKRVESEAPKEQDFMSSCPEKTKENVKKLIHFIVIKNAIKDAFSAGAKIGEKRKELDRFFKIMSQNRDRRGTTTRDDLEKWFQLSKKNNKLEDKDVEEMYETVKQLNIWTNSGINLTNEVKKYIGLPVDKDDKKIDSEDVLKITAWKFANGKYEKFKAKGDYYVLEHEECLNGTDFEGGSLNLYVDDDFDVIGGIVFFGKNREAVLKKYSKKKKWVFFQID